MSDEEETDRSREPIDWDEDYLNEIAGKAPDAKYGALSEAVRHAMPEKQICSMFCGGKKCKFCNPSSYKWKPERMVIKGLFSEWVTENILAMSRPSSEIIEKFDIMTQFKESDIKSIINLQQPGEHASCGGGLVNGEFSYKPQDFMDKDVFFYNFGWPDYGVGSLTNMLDMVKVTQFALLEGKVAIHCHAGLGRTGVLIGCYLVYANRMAPDEAIHYIRKKREGAIQTRNQVACIKEFNQFLKPLRVIFSDVEEGAYDFSLGQYLTRQKHLLHGFEARQLKHIPKIISECCSVLLYIAGARSSSPEGIQQHHDTMESLRASAPGAFNNTRPSSNTPTPRKLDTDRRTTSSLSSNPPHSPTFDASSSTMKSVKSSPDFKGFGYRSDDSYTAVPTDLRKRNMVPEVEMKVGPQESPFGSESDLRRHLTHASLEGDERAKIVAYAMARTEYSEKVRERIKNYKMDLNEDSAATWKNLLKEADPHVVAGVLWDWLDHLKEPVLHPQDMPYMLEHSTQPLLGLAKLEKGCRATIDHLITTIALLGPLPEDVEMEVLQRLLSTLTHQNMVLELDNEMGNTSSSTNTNRFALLRRTSNQTGYMRESVANRLMMFFSQLLRLKQRLIEDGAGASKTSRKSEMSRTSKSKPRRGSILDERDEDEDSEESEESSATT